MVGPVGPDTEKLVVARPVTGSVNTRMRTMLCTWTDRSVRNNACGLHPGRCLLHVGLLSLVRQTVECTVCLECTDLLACDEALVAGVGHVG